MIGEAGLDWTHAEYHGRVRTLIDREGCYWACVEHLSAIRWPLGVADRPGRAFSDASLVKPLDTLLSPSPVRPGRGGPSWPESTVGASRGGDRPSHPIGTARLHGRGTGRLRRPREAPSRLGAVDCVPFREHSLV